MANLPFIAAIDAGIHQEMRRDPSVLYFGQNMATTENHEFVAEYGHDRVRVTPISETAEIGIAIGAAMAGLRPVVELYMAEGAVNRDCFAASSRVAAAGPSCRRGETRRGRTTSPAA